jgi:hypothetical protein
MSKKVVIVSIHYCHKPTDLAQSNTVNSVYSGHCIERNLVFV